MFRRFGWIVYGTLPWLAMVAVALAIARPVGAAQQPPAGAVVAGEALVATPEILTTTLSGAAEVPGPGDLDGSGSVAMTFNRALGTICWEMTVAEIAPPTAAHIHTGLAGVPGGIVVPLTTPTLGTSSGCVSAGATIIGDILANPAAYYVNVHNGDFPAGAIRGNFGLPSLQIQVTAALTGAAEAPNAGDPDGTGSAIVTIDSHNRVVCYDLRVADLLTPTAAHIHVGDPGRPGPVVVTLGTPITGTAAGCVTNVAAPIIHQIVEDPNEFYVNVHNAEYPAGAVRGQLGVGIFTSAVLSGTNEFPGPGDADGTGAAFISLNQPRRTICYDLRVRNILTPTAAHIHFGAAGTSGGVSVTLGTPVGGLASGCVTNVASAIVGDIIANPANYYVNVHTPDFGAGAVRGQLGRAVRNNAILLGSNEVPIPGDPDGFGTAIVTVDQMQRAVCFDLNVAGIAAPTAAHIHTGTVGVPGGVVIGLSPPAGGYSTGCVSNVAADLVMDLIRNPSGHYVNVHNAEYPGGALRGQLDEVGRQVRKVATLSGAAETNGDLDGSGSATVLLNEVSGAICYRLSVRNILRPTAAHIHSGTVGVNGPIVIPLQPPATGSGSISLCETGLNPDLLAAIIENAPNYYVNVHTDDFPAGAIRGQLGPNPTIFLPVVTRRSPGDGW